jgi:HEAT repeat protein
MAVVQRTALLLLLAASAMTSGACSRRVEPPPITESLLNQYLHATPFWRQFEVAEKIVRAGDASILANLEPQLAHEDRHLRGNAAFVFASFGDPRGFETIRAMLTDHAYRPLGQGIPGSPGNPNGADWWLKSQIRADRYYAVHLLGLLRDPRAVELLVPLLADPDVNYKVPWALALIGDARARKALTAALGSPDAAVRDSAKEAIATLNPG